MTWTVLTKQTESWASLSQQSEAWSDATQQSESWAGIGVGLPVFVDALGNILADDAGLAFVSDSAVAITDPAEAWTTSTKQTEVWS